MSIVSPRQMIKGGDAMSMDPGTSNVGQHFINVNKCRVGMKTALDPPILTVKHWSRQHAAQAAHTMIHIQHVMQAQTHMSSQYESQSHGNTTRDCAPHGTKA